MCPSATSVTPPRTCTFRPVNASADRYDVPADDSLRPQFDRAEHGDHLVANRTVDAHRTEHRHDLTRDFLVFSHPDVTEDVHAIAVCAIPSFHRAIAVSRQGVGAGCASNGAPPHGGSPRTWPRESLDPCRKAAGSRRHPTRRSRSSAPVTTVPLIAIASDTSIRRRIAAPVLRRQCDSIGDSTTL